MVETWTGTGWVTDEILSADCDHEVRLHLHLFQLRQQIRANEVAIAALQTGLAIHQIAQELRKKP